MEDVKVDIRQYSEVILRRWRLLILLPIIAGAVAFGVTSLRSAPTSYSGSFPDSGTPSAVEYEASTVLFFEGVEILADYPDLVKANSVLAATIADLGLTGSPEELRRKVAATRVGQGLLQITVTEANADAAISITSGIADSFIRHLSEVRDPQYVEDQAYLLTQLMELNQLHADAGTQTVANALTAASRGPYIVVPAEILVNPLQGPATGPLFGILESNPVRNTALAVLLGVFVSVALILLLDFWQAPVHSPMQLEQRFGLIHLGSIPRREKSAKGKEQLAVGGAGDPGMVEAIQHAGTSMDFTASDRGNKILAVTSAETREGRTSLVANVGVALASSWQNVILVDSDLRHPKLHALFGLDNNVGLTTLLNDPEMALGKVLRETPYPRLQVITSGPDTDNPIGALRCPRMGWLLRQLRETGSMVLLDTPPLLPTADAGIISSQVDGVFLVVDSGRGKMEDVESALTIIKRANAEVLGFVWNKTDKRPFSFFSKNQSYYRGLKHNPSPIASTAVTLDQRPEMSSSSKVAKVPSAELTPQ